MPNARLKIQLDQTAEFLTNGQDKLEWFLAANKGGTFKEMKKAASGGELSRIMLAVKSILAAQSNLPTIIFDEIDTGVSGDIAQKMAVIMSDMGQEMQVISITHLPQIAAKGNHHFKVYKETENEITKTNISVLSKNERIEELAEMQVTGPVKGGDMVMKPDQAPVGAAALLNKMQKKNTPGIFKLPSPE